MKKSLIYGLVALFVLISILIIVNINTTKAIGIHCVGIDINAQEDISENELSVVNSCYEYMENYYTSSLPNDPTKLMLIYDNLNILFNDNLYFKGFGESKFQEYLERDNDYFKNGGVYDDEYMKLLYYTRLISVKLKTDLLLNNDQVFIDDYKSNFSLFLFLNINFIDVILKDSNFTEKPELISTVCDAYDSIIRCVNNSSELALVYQSALKLKATKSNDVRLEKYSTNFFEYMEYLPENLINYKLENTDLNPHEIYLK